MLAIPLVDGGWSDWSPQQSCTDTCALSASRSCDSPAPKHLGLVCRGPATRLGDCGLLPACPVDGGWSAWVAGAECSGTCGRAHREFTRSCDEPEPQSGGKECSGNPTKQEACGVLPECPDLGRKLCHFKNVKQVVHLSLHDFSSWKCVVR